MPWRTPGVGTTDSVENEYIGAAEFYFGAFAPGTFDSLGLMPLGNVTAAEIGQNNDVIFRRNFMRPNKPKRLEINRSRDFNVNASCAEYAPEVLRLALSASEARVVQSATPVVDEPAAGMDTAPVKGGIIVTEEQGPISAFSIEFGGVAGVAGLDYEVINSDVGIYRVLPGTIKTGAVTISYTPTVYTSTTGRVQLNIGAEDTIEGELVIFVNPTHGPKKLYHFPRVSAKPNGALSLLAEDFQEIPLQFTTLDASSIVPGVTHGTVTYLEAEAA
jgi:hypothetical protein